MNVLTIFIPWHVLSGVFHSSTSAISLHHRTVPSHPGLLHRLHSGTSQHPGKLNTSAMKNVDINTNLYICVPELLPLEEKAICYWIMSWNIIQKQKQQEKKSWSGRETSWTLVIGIVAQCRSCYWHDIAGVMEYQVDILQQFSSIYPQVITFLLLGHIFRESLRRCLSFPRPKFISAA